MSASAGWSRGNGRSAKEATIQRCAPAPAPGAAADQPEEDREQAVLALREANVGHAELITLAAARYQLRGRRAQRLRDRGEHRGDRFVRAGRAVDRVPELRELAAHEVGMAIAGHLDAFDANRRGRLTGLAGAAGERNRGREHRNEETRSVHVICRLHITHQNPP